MKLHNTLYYTLCGSLMAALSLFSCQEEELGSSELNREQNTRTPRYTLTVDIDELGIGAGKLDSVVNARVSADGQLTSSIDLLVVKGAIDQADMDFMAGLRYLDSLNLTDARSVRYALCVDEYANSENGVQIRIDTLSVISMPDIQAWAGIALPKNVEYIASMENGRFRYVEIPPSVKGFGASCFRGCTALTNVSLPNIKTIPESCFDECTSLAHVELPDSLQVIDGWAFQDCSSLSSINLPEGLISIGDNAFYNCQALGKITLPESLLSIGGSAFYGCGLLDTELPSQLQTIGWGAFFNDSSMTTINIPPSVTDIGDAAFARTGVTSIRLEATTPLALAMFKGCKRLKSVVMADEIETIPGNSLEYYNGNGGMFSGCDSLTDIHLPANLVSIGEFAFRNCIALKEISLPDTYLREIGDYAFSGSGITSLTIPEKLKECGTGIVGDCPNLTSVIWNSAGCDIPYLCKSYEYSYIRLGNPLIYNNTGVSCDPQNINVITQGHAKEINLLCTYYDNYKENYEFWQAFHCPQAFTADKVRLLYYCYQDNPDDAGGWFSLALPFVPTTFRACGNGEYYYDYGTDFSSPLVCNRELAPFDSPQLKDGVIPFWLMEYTAGDSFRDATAMEAYKPYLIAMPYSNTYLPEYNINKAFIEFSAENVTFEATPDVLPVSAGTKYDFYPNFTRKPKEAGIWSLNLYEEDNDNSYAPGSIFLENYRDVLPFEGYLKSKSGGTTRSVSAFMPVRQHSTRSARPADGIPHKEDK